MTLKRQLELVENDTEVLRRTVTHMNWNPTQAKLDLARRIAHRVMRFAALHNLDVDFIVRTYA